MFFLEGIYSTLFFLFLRYTKPLSSKKMIDLQKKIESVKISYLKQDLKNVFHQTKDPDDFFSVQIRNCLYKGQDCQQRIEALNPLFIRAHLFHQGNETLLRLLRFRGFVVLGGALGGRILIQIFHVQNHFILNHFVKELLLVSSSFIIATFSFQHFCKKLPEFWLGHRLRRGPGTDSDFLNMRSPVSADAFAGGAIALLRALADDKKARNGLRCVR